MRKEIKVLNVVSVFFSIPFFFGNQLKFLKNKGYDVYIASSPSPKLALYAKDQGIKYKEFIIQRNFSICRDLKTLNELRKYIKEERFDIVIGHTPKGALLSMMASFISGTKKRVFFRHGLIYETKKGFVKILLINIERLTSFMSTSIVCVSPYLIEKSIKEKLTKKSKLLLLNKGSCNGVDSLNLYNPDFIDKFKKEELRDKLTISKKDYVIGFVGRLVNDKGVKELVESFLLLKEQMDNIKLLLIGPREIRDALSENTLSIIDNDKNIIEIGHIEAELQYYYSLMDVFVLPTHREGLGTVCLEASSMKLPILTNGKTGSRDSIIDGVTGKYIEISASEIARNILLLMKDPLLSKKYGVNGRKHIIENFHEQIIWNEIEENIYN